MRIDIMTLFPDSMRAVLGESIIGRAAKKGVIDIHCTQIRDYTDNKQMQVDDYPYGGGWGCVMMAQPLKACLDDVMQKAGPRNSRVIYMSPQGKPFTQAEARRLVADYDHLVLVCGHYEGIDERFIEECVDEELSIGDYVLTGGELAAMVVTDCVCRMVPGVLTPNIPVRKHGRGALCRKSSGAETMRRSSIGGGSSSWSGPVSNGRTCLRSSGRMKLTRHYWRSLKKSAPA